MHNVMKFLGYTMLFAILSIGMFLAPVEASESVHLNHEPPHPKVSSYDDLMASDLLIITGQVEELR